MSRWLRPPRLGTIALAAGAGLAALALLGYWVYQERDLLLSYPWQVRWGPVLAAGAIFGVALLLAALIWADLMRTLGSTLPRVTHVRFFVLAQLGKRLPGTVWYVVGRSVLYGRAGDGVGLVTVASALELAVTVVGGVLVSLICLGRAAQTIAVAQWWALGGVAAVALAVLHPAVLRRVLGRVRLSAPSTVTTGRIALWSVGYGLVWLGGGVIFYLILTALVPLGLGHLPYLIGVWSLVGVLSMTVLMLPSNLGFTEIGLSLLLTPILPTGLAVVAAVALRLVLYAFEVAGVVALAGVPWVWARLRPN